MIPLPPLRFIIPQQINVQPVEERDIMEEDPSAEKQVQPDETPNQSTEIPEPSEDAEQNKEAEPSKVGLDDID